MKLWMLALILLLVIFISQAQADEFHVEVQTLYGPLVYVVDAPTDSIALDSVYISAIYNKRLKKVSSATVKETGLSTLDLPQRSFLVTTDTKSYPLHIRVVDSNYAMTAIQAAKMLLSKTIVREIISRYDNTTLKSREAKKYTLKYKGKEVSYLLNVNNPEEGISAFDIAAQISDRGRGYQSTSMAGARFNCIGLFSR